VLPVAIAVASLVLGAVLGFLLAQIRAARRIGSLRV
jgi:ABC-type arginine transport system permease subunit